MLRLSNLTWIRFLVWCGLGLIIYIGYGVSNSQLASKAEPAGFKHPEIYTNEAMDESQDMFE